MLNKCKKKKKTFAVDLSSKSYFPLQINYIVKLQFETRVISHAIHIRFLYRSKN